MSEPVSISVDVVSDVVCPWCFIGQKRLDKAIGTVEGVDVHVSWRPFQLDPTIPAQGKDRREYMLAKFGSEERIRDIHARIEPLGAAEGIARDAPNQFAVGKEAGAVTGAEHPREVLSGRDVRQDTREFVSPVLPLGIGGDLQLGHFDQAALHQRMRRETARIAQIEHQRMRTPVRAHAIGAGKQLGVVKMEAQAGERAVADQTYGRRLLRGELPNVECLGVRGNGDCSQQAGHAQP